MKYLKYTYISKATGISVFNQPDSGETENPAVTGLEFLWVNISKYPTLKPELFGTCPDTSDTNVEGVLEVMTKETWENEKQQELDRQFNCPATLTAKQIRLALLEAGLLQQVEIIVKTLPEDQQITWEYAVEIYRNSTLIKQIATQLDLFEVNPKTELSKIDQIFRNGEQL